jgi:restriction system protein
MTRDRYSFDSYDDYPPMDRRTMQQVKREQAQLEAAARDQQAAAATSEIEWRVNELETVLRSSLDRDPQLEFDSLRQRFVPSPPRLGALAAPPVAPDWSEYAPTEPAGISRMFGGAKRYAAELASAQQKYAAARDEYRRHEQARQRLIAERQQDHQRSEQEAERWIAEYNARIDQLERAVHAGERHAVSDYLQMVLERSSYPRGFPVEPRAGYVPESSLLAVEWYLPSVDIVPQYQSYRHIKTRKTVEPTARPVKETRRLYQRMIAQIAIRVVREVFAASPMDLISTVAFTGRVRAVDPATGQPIQPPLITMRATRDQIAPLILDEPKLDPVQCVRKHFYADISPHPDELIPVEPVMDFDMADPRVVDPIDVLSDIDRRPNLLELSAKEFEAFVQNLFTKMGFDTKLYRASGDGGIDCVAYDPHPIAGGKFIIQAKLYTKTVAPTHVRDLWGTVQHEGATKGIMITTSGYGPDSYAFVANKPLKLIDGSGLLSLCHQHDIPARILPRGGDSTGV